MSTIVESHVEAIDRLPDFKGQSGWEFTPLKGFDADAFADAPAGSPSPDAGGFAPAGAIAPSADAATSEGPLVLPLAVAREQHAELVERHLGSLVGRDGFFTARNADRFTDGAFVFVPRGVTLDAPIVVDAVQDQDATTLHHRTLVVLEEGAEAEVWDVARSADPDAAGAFNGAVELVVGQGARLRYVGVQDASEQSWVFATQRATLARDAHLDWVALGLGGKSGKVVLQTRLDGPGAEGRVTGAYAPHARQHVDFDTLQEHAAERTTSDLAFRGILADRASSVWRGMIKVDPGAQQTDAFQDCRNLLLTKKAHADAIPGLEILANDVRCTHAAAIAQIDPEQLFYLRARGLREERARRLVIEGFLAALLERFDEGPFREQLATVLERRLEAVL